MLPPCMEELVNDHMPKAAPNFPRHTWLPFPAPSTDAEHLRTVLANCSDVWPAVFFPSVTASQAGLPQMLRWLRLDPPVISVVS